MEVDSDGDIVLKEVFNGISLQTEEGNCLGVCMRDDTFEISMFKRNEKGGPKTAAIWFHVDFDTGTIFPVNSDSKGKV